jgi:hypothetical protein
MQYLTNAAMHNKHSILGTIITFTLGFIGKAALSDAALIMGILSGLVTSLYTCWKWHVDYKKLHSSKSKK